MFSTTYKIVNPQVIEEFLENVEPSKNEAIVRIDKLAVCKADLRYYLGLRAKEVLEKKYPLTPIHEAVGVILKDPSGKFKKGDHVILVPNFVDESKCSSCLIRRCKDYESNSRKDRAGYRLPQAFLHKGKRGRAERYKCHSTRNGNNLDRPRCNRYTYSNKGRTYSKNLIKVPSHLSYNCGYHKRESTASA